MKNLITTIFPYGINDSQDVILATIIISGPIFALAYVILLRFTK